MEAWIPITIAAAFFQNARSALQKHLKTTGLSNTGATFVRFSYAVPFAFVYVLALHRGLSHGLPGVNSVFAFYVLVVAASQIVATALLLRLFASRNFAVATTYSKTEVIQTAAFAMVILGDTVSRTALVAMIVSVAGVMLLSLAQSTLTLRNLVTGWTKREALIGLASGAGFAVAAVSVRGASLSLEGGHFLMRAAFTLLAVTLVQTFVMTIYLRWRERGELTRVIRAWRVAGLVGLCGMLASVGWFSAMTIQNAAYVRALGQIELVFTFAVSYVFFRERSSLTDLVGISLVVGGIVMLLLGR